MRNLSRRTFLEKLLIFCSGPLFLRCGGETTAATGTQNACSRASSLDGAISTNHGHLLTISHADVVAGVDKAYDIQGTGTHSHSVTITAAHFASLNNNTTISNIVSTNTNSHTHTITVFCV